MKSESISHTTHWKIYQQDFIIWSGHLISGSFQGRGGGGGGGTGLMADPTPSRPSLVQTKIQIQSPYKGWQLYFPDESKGLFMKTFTLLLLNNSL